MTYSNKNLEELKQVFKDIVRDDTMYLLKNEQTGDVIIEESLLNRILTHPAVIARYEKENK